MELRELSMWRSERPTPEALSSHAPFCVDTLTFDQWLQWIFIPRMVDIIEQGEGMPGACNIRPMGEEAFAHLGQQHMRLIEVLGDIDRLATRLV
ncbi:YqcC family protein [Halopseudomonas nanhaiensis]|nr:YqcC family protein [Halopseudomonas nanhaiensis]